MKLVFIPHWFLIFFFFLVLSHVPLPVSVATTVTFDEEVHFLAPGGEDVRVSAGDYEVEPVEGGLRLIPESTQDSVLINAEVDSHQEEDVAKPTALSVPTGEDLHYLVLLLPDGQRLLSVGSYSGVRARSVNTPYVVPQFDVVYVQGDLRTLSNVDLESCSAECLNEGQCNAYTWKPATKSCSLKDQKAVPRPDNRGISGIKKYSNTHQARTVVPKLEKWFGPASKDLTKYNGLSLEQCSLKCLQDPKCTAFTWKIGKGTQRPWCQLIPYRSPQPKHTGSDYISGIMQSVSATQFDARTQQQAAVTQANLPKCIRAAQRGPEARFLVLYGQKWHCKPTKITRVGRQNVIIIEGQLSRERQNDYDWQVYYQVVQEFDLNAQTGYNGRLAWVNMTFKQRSLWAGIASNLLGTAANILTGGLLNDDLVGKAINKLVNQPSEGWKKDASKIVGAIGISLRPR